ncbi:unnamed protein product [Camellia sinensis]
MFSDGGFLTSDRRRNRDFGRVQIETAIGSGAESPQLDRSITNAVHVPAMPNLDRKNRSDGATLSNLRNQREDCTGTS